MHSMQNVVTVPWYRQAWPWFLISLPAAAVLAGSATWYLAWRSNDGLVAQNYYKQGLEINRSIESQQLARQLGLSAVLQMPDGKIHLRLSAVREITLPPKLVLNIISPAREGFDKRVELLRNGDAYEAPLPVLTPGHWNLSLADEAGTWSILGTAILPLKGEMLIKP